MNLVVISVLRLVVIKFGSELINEIRGERSSKNKSKSVIRSLVVRSVASSVEISSENSFLMICSEI